MEVKPIFRNRAEAGKALGELVADTVTDPNPLVLALPRGGIQVAFEVARILNAELDVFLVRKLGVPGQEELAIGAIASGKFRILNQALIAELHVSDRAIDLITAREELELKRREELYRRGRPAHAVGDRTVILVDDGLATGASMKAAVTALRAQQPKRIVVAAPVAAKEVFNEFRRNVGEIVCLHVPRQFTAVGVWYEDFSQVTDDEVQHLLGN